MLAAVEILPIHHYNVVNFRFSGLMGLLRSGLEKQKAAYCSLSRYNKLNPTLPTLYISVGSPFQIICTLLGSKFFEKSAHIPKEFHNSLIKIFLPFISFFFFFFYEL